MCCNGVIFADVKLQSGDDPKKLRKLGMRLVSKGVLGGGQTSRSHLPMFRQPCAVFQDGRCQIYGDRPRYCREFECLLLKNVLAGRISKDRALVLIAELRDRSAQVDQLLRQLGDTDTSVSLSNRFHQTGARLEAVGLDKQTADIYGDLTVAMHDLNFLLSDSFYPG